MDKRLRSPDPQAVLSLFGAVVDLAPDQRSAYLDDACRTDLALRLEIDSLLEASEDLPRGETVMATLGAEEIVMPDPGSRIGDYVVDSLVDIGGFGEVYLASRADGRFERQVALKVLNGLEGEAELARFHKEAQTLAKLNHPQIAQLYDAKITPEGRPFLILEYVDGKPINRYCRDNGLDTRRRVELFLDLCSAVDFAQQNFIIHGDLKPSNVLVTDDGQVKLLDFGISRLAGEGRVAAGVGTPEFASPEQKAGEALTTASDVYSLGVLLGRLVENGEGRLRGGMGDLGLIIEKAVQPLASERYSTVSQLSDDLRRFLKDLPVTTGGGGFPYRTRKFLRRNRWGVLAVFLILLSLLVGSAAAFWQARIAAAERDVARAEARKAKALSDLLLGLYAGIDPIREGSNEVSARQLLDSAAEKVENDLDAEPIVQASMMTAIGRVYRNIGEFERARDLLEKGMELRTRDAGSADAGEVGESVHELATLDFSQGRFESAEKGLRKALDLRIRAFGADSLEVAETRSTLAFLLRNVDRLDEAEREARSALQIRIARFGENHSLVAHAYGLLASLHFVRGDPAQAETDYRKALDIYEGLSKPVDAFFAETLNDLAISVKRLGRLDEAESLLQRALEIRKRLHGESHRELATVLGNISQVHKARGDLAEAEKYARDSVQMTRRTLGDEHPGLATSLNNLAILVKDRGDLAAAEPLYLESLEIRLKALPPGHRDIAQSYNNLAVLKARMKDYHSAEKYMRLAVDGHREAYGADHPLYANALNNLGWVLERLGEPERAEALYREAIPIFEAKSPMNEAGRVAALVNLSRLLKAGGRCREAEPLLRRAFEGSLRLYGEGHAKTDEARLALEGCVETPSQRQE